MKLFTRTFSFHYLVLKLSKTCCIQAACLVVFFSSTSFSVAQTKVPTLLNYDLGTSINLANQLPTQSAFHNLDDAIQEARKIQTAWVTEAVSVPWTRLQLNSYVKHKISPTRGARGLALMHVAMFDAYLIARDRKIEPKIVVSTAAAQVLTYLFVTEEGYYDRVVGALIKDLGDAMPASSKNELQQALALGLKIGKTVVAYAESDGAQKGWNGSRLQYYGENRYFGPGTWEPTPPYFYYPPDEPFAPTWKTWALDHANQFRPVPPSYGSPKYVQDLNEVIAVKSNLTDDQKKVARFWVDGHGSVTPAGHWNQIALDEAKTAKLTDLQTTMMFALLNIAMADTFIAVWDAKYHYWTARPSTAAKYSLGVDFNSTLITPPFPSYVSGHAGFSGAAAVVISAFLPQRKNVLAALAQEAAHSRLLAGIHFRHDNDDGLILGNKIASKVLEKFKVSYNEDHHEILP